MGLWPPSGSLSCLSWFTSDSVVCVDHLSVSDYPQSLLYLSPTFPCLKFANSLVSLLLIFGTPGKISCILWLVLFLDTHVPPVPFIHSFILQEQWRVKWNDNLKKVQYAITAIYKWVSNSWIQEPMDALKWKRVWVLICLWLVRRLDPISSWEAESNMDPAKGGHMVEAWTRLES